MPSLEALEREERSNHLIERLFARFGAIYGARFINLWAGVDPEEMKRTWGERLSRFDPQQVGRAVEQCEEHVTIPPTLPQFVELVRSCYQAPAEPYKPVPVIEYKLDPIASGAEAIADAEYPKPSNGFGVWWACRIVRTRQLGGYPHFYGFHAAMQVLKLTDINELAEKYRPKVDEEREAIQGEPNA